MIETEIWKTIEGFDDYEVSNLGRVKSYKNNKERILKTNKPYHMVSIFKNGITTYKQIHRLVYETFSEERLKSNECVHHKNEDPADNRFENLRKMNKSDHSMLHRKGKKGSSETREKMSKSRRKREIQPNSGKDLSGEKGPNHKLTKKEVIQIKFMMKQGLTNKYIHGIYSKVKYNAISNIRCNKSWVKV